MTEPAARIARARVPLGFAAGAAALYLAHPTPASLAGGLALAAVGESIRVWAAGHLEKGREVTSSGPYRFTGHPLYLGSTILGIGFAVASRSLAVAAIAAIYLGVTLGAAIRSEEAGLRARFGDAYADYRAGRSQGASRRFCLARARRNREHRAVAGLGVVMFFLALKGWLRL